MDRLTRLMCWLKARSRLQYNTVYIHARHHFFSDDDMAARATSSNVVQSFFLGEQTDVQYITYGIIRRRAPLAARAANFALDLY